MNPIGSKLTLVALTMTEAVALQLIAGTRTQESAPQPKFEEASIKVNFVLEFAVDENLPEAPDPRPPVGEPSDIPIASTIFRALPEQLGLMLAKAKARRAMSSLSIAWKGPHQINAYSQTLQADA